MEISIGDIIDRYTICKLKYERVRIDTTKELGLLNNEISRYNDLEFYIEQLYKINGQIWDLESDIRLGKEEKLGLDEVGRRALLIRDLNNVRVSLKNEINSKNEQGFIEIKMAHLSATKPSLIISLTTVPERLNENLEDGVKGVIKSLCEQNDKDYEVHFNIPDVYKITNKPYTIPDWLNQFKLRYPHLKVFRPEDMGPPTKLVPTLERIHDPETILLVVDDDLFYHPDMVSEHRKYQELLKDSVICYEGRSPKSKLYDGDLRDCWVICVTEIREVESFQHYKSASYKKKLFTDVFYEKYIGKTLSDDVLISRYMMNTGVKMFVVPYEKDLPKFSTKELWDVNQGVTTFPVLKHASINTPKTGCNHPDLIKLPNGARFYDPMNLGE